MAEFDFLNATKALQSSLRKERGELNQQRDQFDEVQNAVLRETTQDAADHAEFVAQVSEEQAADLGGILQNLNRIDEIEGSFTLQLIEPIVGIWDPSYSRKKLTRDALAKQQRVQVRDSQVATQQVQFSANQAVRKSTLAEASGRLDAELADVESVRAEIADTIQARQLQLQEEAVALETLPLQQLKALVQKGELTEPQLRQETLRRQNQEVSAQSAQLALKAQNLSLFNAQKQQYFLNMGLAETNDLISQAQNSPEKKVEVNGFTFTLPELQQNRKAFIESSAITAQEQADAEASVIATQASMSVVQRLYGQSPEESITIESQMDALANDPNVPPRVRAEAARNKALLEQAAHSQTAQGTKTEIYKRVAESALKLEEERLSERVKAFPAEQQAGAKEFFEKNLFENTMNATTFLVDSLTVPTTSGNPHLDQALAALDLSNDDAFVTGDDASTLQSKIVQGEPELTLLEALQKTGVRDEITGRIFSSARFELYENIAREMGDSDLVEQLNNPNSPVSYSDRALFAYLKERKESQQTDLSITEYANRVRQASFAFGQSAFTPRGPAESAAKAAAVNAIFLNNQGAGLFSADVMRQIFAGLSDQDAFQNIPRPDKYGVLRDITR